MWSAASRAEPEPEPEPVVITPPPEPEPEPEPEPVVVTPPPPVAAAAPTTQEQLAAATTQEQLAAPTVQPPTAPPPAAPPERPPPRSGGAGRYVAGVAAIVAVVAVAGFLIARSGSEEEPAAKGKQVSNDSLAVTLPSGSGGGAGAIPGLALKDEIAAGLGSGASVHAGLSDGAGPTLLPAAFRRRLGEQPSQEDRVRFGGLTGYRYRDLEVDGVDRPVTAYVAPTTNGVATVACVDADGSCGEVAASLKVTGDPVSLGPDKAYAAELNPQLEGLDGKRRSGRAALARAKTRGAQAQAAAGLAGAYRAAAKNLGQTVAPREAREAHAALVAALGRAATAHQKMEAAARAGRKAAFGRATDAASQSERAVNKAIAGFAPLGYS